MAPKRAPSSDHVHITKKKKNGRLVRPFDKKEHHLSKKDGKGEHKISSKVESHSNSTIITLQIVIKKSQPSTSITMQIFIKKSQHTMPTSSL